MSIRRYAFALLFLLIGSCSLFEPTTRQRRLRPAADPPPVPVNLEEEFPEVDFLPQPEREPSRMEEYSHEVMRPEAVWPEIGDDKIYSLEFRGQSLGQAIHFLAREAEINIYLDPRLDAAIDLSFPRVTLDQAFRALLTRNGMRLVEEPPGMYWVTPDDGSQIETGSFTVHSVHASEIEPLLQALVDEETKIIVNDSQNLIVVKGPASDIDLVADYLDRADRLKRQVLIEVRILEVNLDERFEFGIAAAVENGSIDGALLNILQAFSTPGDSFQIQLESSGGGIDSTIQALSNYVGVDMVSSPRVLTVTNTAALVEVVQEVPYVNVTDTVSGTTGGVGQTVIQEVQFKEAGIKMTVTPTIQEGGFLHIKIDKEFSEVVGFFNEVPVVDTRKLVSEFLVGDRDTIVLGGLMQDRLSKTDSGIPGLMDVPVFGRLFHSDQDLVIKRELVIFLTPRIVDPEEANQLSRSMQSVYQKRLQTTGITARTEHESEGE